MTQFGRRASQSKARETTLSAHQERVYGEFFKAIEQVGRRLERTESERDRLATRVSNLESRAEKDELTGNYYLPVRADHHDDSHVAPMPKSVMAASFVSVFVALFALGVVLTQEPTLSKEQIAALQFNPPKYANLNPQSPYWQKVDLSQSGQTSAPVKREAPTEEVADIYSDTRPDEAELAEVVNEPDPLIQSILNSLENTSNEQAGVNIDAEEVDVAIQENITPEAGEEIVLNIPIEEIAPAAGEQSAEDIQEATTVANEPAPAPVEVAKAPEVVAKPAPAVAKQEPVKAEVKPVVVETQKSLTPLQAVDAKPDPSLPESLKSLEARALDGVAEAQHDLATLYAAGNNVKADYSRALFWFKQAADGGIANAHYNLGVMAHQGLGQAVDMTGALKWYQNAAELGHPEALYNLGIAFTEGIGVDQDIERGASYFKRAAEVGVAQAAYNLGILYESSFLGGIDKPEAAKWYKTAAESGHQDALASYARITGQSLEVSADSVQSIEPAAGMAQQDLIESIQSILITEKYLPGYADGVMGAQTVDAIKAYERANGLSVTGQATPELLSYMRAE